MVCLLSDDSEEGELGELTSMGVRPASSRPSTYQGEES